MEVGYQLAAVIQGDGMVTNLEFHEKGQYLVMTTNEHSIQLIDCFAGMEKKKLFAKSDGVSKIQFTHHESSVIMSSCLNNCYDIKYLCMYDNRYLRNFCSHTKEVTAIAMNPVNDQFLSTSLDGTMCLWDLSSPNAIAKLKLPLTTERSYCAYDSSGMVFGVLSQDSNSSSSLKLYDARSYENGPFENICPSMNMFEQALVSANPSMNQQQLSRLMKAKWTSFEFSCDGGQQVLLNTNSEALFLLDGFKATAEPKVILSRKNDSNCNLGAAMSSSAKYVLTGNEDNEVLIYDKDSLNLVATLNGEIFFCFS